MKFLIIKELNSKFEFSRLLSERNVGVTEIGVYQSVFEDSSQIPKLKALIRGGSIDEFIFTAPEDVFSVLQIFKDENPGKVFEEIKITANDEITLQTFNEHQWLNI